jgi:selenocysteine-specific elongation factor
MEVLAALVEDGSAVRVSTELYFDRAAYDAMVCRVVAALSDGASCSVAELRDLLGTSRKYALALLEHLDGLQVTRRVGDTRVLGSRAPACV